MPVEKGVDDEEAPVTEDSAGLVKNSNSTKIDCHVGFCRTAQVTILNPMLELKNQPTTVPTRTLA